MADFVLTNAYVMINTVDLSDHVESLNLPFDVEALDDTCMADSSRAFLPGLKNGTLSVTFKQDFASAKTDATVYAVYLGGAAVACKVRPTASAISATNPEFQFNAVLTSYTPITGTVGDIATAPVEFQITGDVTRAVA